MRRTRRAPSPAIRRRPHPPGQAHAVLAHAAGRHAPSAAPRRQALGVESQLDLILGCRPEHGELLLPAQADVGLLGRGLERAELADLGVQPLVERAQRRLGAGVDRVQRIAVRAAGTAPAWREAPACWRRRSRGPASPSASRAASPTLVRPESAISLHNCAKVLPVLASMLRSWVATAAWGSAMVVSWCGGSVHSGQCSLRVRLGSTNSMQLERDVHQPRRQRRPARLGDRLERLQDHVAALLHALGGARAGRHAADAQRHLARRRRPA